MLTSLLFTALARVTQVTPAFVPIISPSAASFAAPSPITASLVLKGERVEWALARAGGWQRNYEAWPASFDFETEAWTVGMLGCDFRSALEGKTKHFQSAKALFRRTGAVGGSPIATSVAGLRCELQPLFDPTTGDGGETPIVFIVNGSEVEGATISVTINGASKPSVYTTNTNGVATIPHSAGKYQIIGQWFDKSSGAATWYSTSLTYEVSR